MAGQKFSKIMKLMKSQRLFFFFWVRQVLFWWAWSKSRVKIAGPNSKKWAQHSDIGLFWASWPAQLVVQHVTYVTDFCGVCRRVVYPSWGTTRRIFQFFIHGRRSCAATCQITREGGAITDICTVVFGSIALVSLHARQSSLWQHSRQQARSSILAITVRFVPYRHPNRCSL